MREYEEYKKNIDLLGHFYSIGRYEDGKVYEEKALKARDNFTLEDWQELISNSSGREKYEYTKMMKEKFGDQI